MLDAGAASMPRFLLVLEFVALYLVLPLAYRFSPVHLPALPLLWAVTGYALWQLLRDPHFNRAQLWSADRLPGNLPAIPITFAALLLSACAAIAQAQSDPLSDPLVVRTNAGLIRGVARPGGGAEFLGMPYAQPPVGDLRWRAPVPAKPWAGIRDAKAFGASCTQPLLVGAWNRYDADHGQEDCLYLNVIVPMWPAAKPLPVMLWLHGGANLGGSGSGDLYNSGTLADHGVVLVTINYRLGVFGFLAHPALTTESPHHASGNYGLMDQILALKWVRDNIAGFGGDPTNITVFGQSAGSIDTGILMTSPLAAGRFQKAIGFSGAAFSPPLASLTEAEQKGVDTAKALNVPAGSDGIAAMRNIEAHELITKLGSRATDWPGFGPDVDGWVLTRSPAAVFAAGDEAPIPLLLGTTSREFGSSEPIDQLRASITRANADLAPQALALYGLADNGQGTADPLYGSAAMQWSADELFHCPITTEALWHSAAHHATFEYELDHAIPGQEAQGAVHSAELPYVFGYFPTSGNIGGNFGEQDKQLTSLIEGYLTNFAKTGNPNSAGLPPWPALDKRQSFLRFTEDATAVVSTTPLRGPQCDLYRKVLAEQMKQAK
jgi:para-nitrobenzyl esterase